MPGLITSKIEINSKKNVEGGVPPAVKPENSSLHPSPLNHGSSSRPLMTPCGMNEVQNPMEASLSTLMASANISDGKEVKDCEVVFDPRVSAETPAHSESRLITM